MRARNAQHILEIGTSSGYSTIWLADAAEQTEGSVLSVDVISHENELVEFTRMIEAEKRLTQTVVAIGAGLRVAVRN